MQDAQDRESGGKKAKKKRESRQAAVRWYDARARVSLRRLSVWLVVPWDRVATFECLFAESANQVSHVSMMSNYFSGCMQSLCFVISTYRPHIVQPNQIQRCDQARENCF